MIWLGEMSFQKNEIKGIFKDEINDPHCEKPFRITLIMNDDKHYTYATINQTNRDNIFDSLLCELGLN